MQLVKCESRSDDSLIPKQFLPTGGSKVKILIEEEEKPKGKNVLVKSAKYSDPIIVK